MSESHVGSPATPTIQYDLNGNLLSDGEYTYTYNPWNQLVQIEYGLGGGIAAVYRYGATFVGSTMIAEQMDTNDAGNHGSGDGDVDVHDSVFYLALDPQGRRVGVFRGTDAYAKEVYQYHAAEASGPAGSGLTSTGYSAVLFRERETNVVSAYEKYDYAASASARAERIYYCPDRQGRPAALVNSSGTLAGMTRFSTYGVPQPLVLGDLDADGEVESGGGVGDDYSIIDEYNDPGDPYDIRADLDLDGDVDSADLAIVNAANGTQGIRGYGSALGVNNRMMGAGVGHRYGVPTYVSSIGISNSEVAPLRTRYSQRLALTNESSPRGPRAPWDPSRPGDAMPYFPSNPSRIGDPACIEACRPTFSPMIMYCREGQKVVCGCWPEFIITPPDGRPWWPRNPQIYDGVRRCVFEFELGNAPLFECPNPGNSPPVPRYSEQELYCRKQRNAENNIGCFERLPRLYPDQHSVCERARWVELQECTSRAFGAGCGGATTRDVANKIKQCLDTFLGTDCEDQPYSE